MTCGETGNPNYK